MSTKTYNIGPKLGDFIHGLVTCSYIYDTTGKKAVVYISDNGCTFTTSLEQTFNELRPILDEQEYVEDFRIWSGEKVDYEIFRFRECPDIFRKGWTDIYSWMIKGKIPDDYVWLKCKHPMPGGVVMNRSIRYFSRSTDTYYKTLLKDEVPEFLCFSKDQQEAFPQETKLVLCRDLYDMYNRIAGCKLFIGNQSSPLAIASALGVERIAELRKSHDAPHYGQERSKKLKTFIGD